MKLLILIFLTSLSFAQTPSLEERISKLEEKLEESELQNEINSNFKISGLMINHFEYLNEQRSKGDTTNDSRDETLTPLSTLAAISFDFKIRENLNFFSTISMGKFWNNDEREQDGALWRASNRGSFAYTGDEVKMDMAYLRHQLTNNLTLSLGRLSTNNGPPANQLDGLPRYGTYPRFGYNGIFDGASLAYDFSNKLPKDLSYKIRLFYTPYIFVDSRKRNRTITDDSNFGNSNEKVKSRADQIAILNELEFKNLSWTKSLLLYSLFWNYETFYDSDFQVDEADRSGIEYYRANSHLLYIGFNEIGYYPLNFSMSQLMVRSRLQGYNQITSEGYLWNLNYKFEKSFLKEMTIGTEYLVTDKNFYLDEHSYTHIIDFYQRSASHGNHYYLSFPLSVNQILRFGHYHVKAERAPSNFYNYKSNINGFYSSYRVQF
jgi:hypothetical protein